MTATITPSGTSDDNFAARPTDVNDVDHILAAYDDKGWADDIGRTVELNADAWFTWDYERSRPALSKLYEKAKTSQWNGTTDLDWSIDVDPEEIARGLMQFSMERFKMLQGLPGSPFKNFGEKEWMQVGVEMQRFQLSQFLHGEQGALMVAGYVTATTPWIDAKYYAATQTVDEARHVEVFARYLDEKLGGSYPMNPNLGALITDTLTDSRWDLTYLGMQIMVEGLALAAFGAMFHTTTEPLLKQLLRYVMSDEARHVAFGVLTLREFYEGLSDAEMRERQEFTFDCAERLRNRFFMVDVWERMGVDPRAVLKVMQEHPAPQQADFQRLLFSKIVPNTKKLGLLDASDGWLRKRFEHLGVIEFEDWVDTSEEYANLDAFEADAKTTN